MPSLCKHAAMSKGCHSYCCATWRPRAASGYRFSYQVCSLHKQSCVITWLSLLSLGICVTSVDNLLPFCRAPAQLEHISNQLTSMMYTLSDSGAIDPAVVTDTVSAKNGGFFGPLASLFETFLKVRQLFQCVGTSNNVLQDTCFANGHCCADIGSRNFFCWNPLLIRFCHHPAYSPSQAGHLPPVKAAGKSPTAAGHLTCPTVTSVHDCIAVLVYIFLAYILCSNV